MVVMKIIRLLALFLSIVSDNCGMVLGQSESASLLETIRGANGNSIGVSEVYDKYILKCTSKQNMLNVLIKVMFNTFAEKIVLENVYFNSFFGFSVSGLSDAHINALKSDNRISFISKSQPLTLALTTQLKAVWNLDRIDQITHQLDQKFNYINSGFNVNAYVLDSGIKADHTEFRTSTGTSRVKNGYNALLEDFDDEFGHGTQVAAVIGGNTLGVAKQISLINVKVFNSQGEGNTADVVAGIDYVIGQKKLSPKKAMIMNLSFVGEKDKALNDAVSTAVRSGILVVVAAGNDNDDACYFSPAYVTDTTARDGVITVGSTQVGDYKAWYSNSGPCVDIYAPGRQIFSACNQNTNCTTSVEGTSLSAAHVSGVAAQIYQSFPTLTPAQIWQKMKAVAVSDLISSYYPYDLLPGTPNLMLRSTF